MLTTIFPNSHLGKWLGARDMTLVGSHPSKRYADYKDIFIGRSTWGALAAGPPNFRGVRCLLDRELAAPQTLVGLRRSKHSADIFEESFEDLIEWCYQNSTKKHFASRYEQFVILRYYNIGML